MVKKEFKKNYIIYNNTAPKKIAKLLEKNEIIALAIGNEEFGARALGNRSIIANPSDTDVIRKINLFIKNRDFWMPFAITVLKHKANKYLLNSKRINSSYMNFCFDTKDKYFNDIRSGCHNYDKTVRPQFLRKQENKIFYEIIDSFSKLTNIDAVLNTSLNLHGKPKASNYKSVFDTFRTSGIQYLYLEGKILVKKL